MDNKSTPKYFKEDKIEEANSAYSNALNFITLQSNNLNSISCTTNQLNFPVYKNHLKSNLELLQDNLYALNTLPSLLPAISQVKSQFPYLTNSRDAILSISTLATRSAISSLATSIANDYKPWLSANVINIAKNSTNSLASICINDFGNNLSQIIGPQNLSALTLQTGILKSSQFSTYAEKSLFSITKENFGSKISLIGDSKVQLDNSILKFSDSYARLTKSFEVNPVSYTTINPTLSRLVPIEYFSAANLVEVISVDEEVILEEVGLRDEIQYENEVDLNRFLSKLDKGLYSMWEGAIEAYHSENPDRIRHFSSSLRELFTHVLHILSPEEEVKNWIKDESLLHNGRPTRRARLLYVCRNINNYPFEDFVEKDVNSTLAVIDMFQEGTHKISSNFSEKQLLALKCKAECTIKFLLQIHFI